MVALVTSLCSYDAVELPDKTVVVTANMYPIPVPLAHHCLSGTSSSVLLARINPRNGDVIWYQLYAPCSLFSSTNLILSPASQVSFLSQDTNSYGLVLTSASLVDGTPATSELYNDAKQTQSAIPYLVIIVTYVQRFVGAHGKRASHHLRLVYTDSKPYHRSEHDDADRSNCWYCILVVQYDLLCTLSWVRYYGPPYVGNPLMLAVDSVSSSGTVSSVWLMCPQLSV